MPRTNIRVQPEAGRWVVRWEGGKRASGIFPTQAEALAFARRQAAPYKAVVELCGRDGELRQRTRAA